MWNQLSSEQKKTYGEDYYEAAMTSVEKYSRQVSCSKFPSKNRQNKTKIQLTSAHSLSLLGC